VRSTTARRLAVLVATAAAALAVAATPGSAQAAEDDRIDCVVNNNIVFMTATYTCETQTEDISWYLTGRCASPIHGGWPTRSATVEGSGTATISCPVAGPIASGPVDIELIVL